MLNCEDLEVSFKGVSVAALQISMFRHEKGSCYNSDIQCPICPKLHMFEKTPDLNISTCQYSDIAIAPPAGNRKWHVLRRNKLLLEILWHFIIFFGQSNLKAFAMLNCEHLEVSLKGVAMAPWQSSMSRHGNRSCCNSGIRCPIFPKLHMFEKSLGLNTPEGQYSTIIIAPPADNRKWLVLH